MSVQEVKAKVDKRPCYTIGFDGKPITIPVYALMRRPVNSKKETFLGTTSPKWRAIQNEEAIKYIKEFAKLGGLTIAKSGSLNKGKLFYATLRLPDTVTLFGGDEIESYLLFSSQQEYGSAPNFRFMALRKASNSTFISAAGKRSNLRSNFEVDKDAVDDYLWVCHNKMEAYASFAKRAAAKPCSDEEAEVFFSEVWPSMSQSLEETKSRAVDTAMRALKTMPGAEFAPGTWWATWNVVPYLCDNVLGNSPQTRLWSNWYGPNRRRKAVALQMVIDRTK